MPRITLGLVTCLALVSLGLADPPANPSPAGTWRFTAYRQDQQMNFWIIKFENKDGKWSGTMVENAKGLPKGNIEDISVKGDQFRFNIAVADDKQAPPVKPGEKAPPAKKEQFPFVGVIGKDGKKIRGAFHAGKNLWRCELVPTKLTSLDPFDVEKETFADLTGPEVWETAYDLLRKAGFKKAKPEEVRMWASRAYKAAGEYGPHWQRTIGLRLAQILADQEPYAAVAVEYARQTNRLLEPGDSMDFQISVLETVAPLLKKAGKADEAKEMEAKVAKLIVKDYEEYQKKVMTFKPDTYAGRKAKSDRAVLVELFTGVQCPPCVAADIAFDAVEKSYTPKDVILLEYHVHIPAADPLTAPDSLARSEFYDIQGTPAVFVNGAPKVDGGGGIDEAQDIYKEFQKAINPQLETTTKVKLQASAVRKGDKIEIKAEASDIEKPGPKVRLRLVLVEERLRFSGPNGMRYHHRVVRDMPGGAAGLAIKDKSAKQSVTVDLAELRKKLSATLDSYSRKNQDPMPPGRRPMEMKDLYVVAFVQNDEGKEVLQATQVKVTEGK